MRLGQDDAAAGVEPRHHDAAVHRLGPRRQDAEPAGPALVAQDVRDDELRRPGAVLVGHGVGDMAVALHRLRERAVDRRVAVAQIVRDELAHEVEQPRAVGEHEVVAVGRIDGRDAVLGLRLQPVQVVGPVPTPEFVPVACHGAPPKAGHGTNARPGKLSPPHRIALPAAPRQLWTRERICEPRLGDGVPGQHEEPRVGDREWEVLLASLRRAASAARSGTGPGVVQPPESTASTKASTRLPEALTTCSGPGKRPSRTSAANSWKPATRSACIASRIL